MINKTLSKKQEILLLLMLSSLFSVTLLGFRLYKTGALVHLSNFELKHSMSNEWIYLFLIWNLFLAWIPYFLTYNLDWISTRFGGNFLVGISLVCWLLFLPNAPYLVTDLIHLKLRPPLPLWYDTFLLFSFAWTGLLLGVFSLIQARDYWARHISRSTATAFVFVSLALCSLGIYMGRFQRFNSWDILSDPFGLINEVWQVAINPMENIRYFGITAVVFGLLSIGYLFFNSLINHNEKR